MPSPSFKTRLRLLPLLIGLAALAGPVAAQSGAPATPPDASSLPTWERLTPEQRERLITPLRDRWNNEPDARARMLAHAQRWQDMTPEERSKARSGMKRWRHMNPEQRDQMRALFSRMRALPPEQRAALKTKWRAMTPEQRREWVDANPPPPEDRQKR
ncbi:MAG: hypothetical protein A2190_02565 [Lysobacterales bacterium RIFOXYA1_FULL_69_10]|nr:MAG: hypothetical protein A2190_02565 [Xanthomonadales bacterium RIFOXYA1_FULL_69_10]